MMLSAIVSEVGVSWICTAAKNPETKMGPKRNELSQTPCILPA